MYFKLAKRNMHRSMKEYAVYFITLIFSVALFYSFNSIDDQKVFLELSDNWASAFRIINLFLNAASVFVMFILAFLILYANNYLIRRRKKELGIYLTLGMENQGISKILFLETFILGMVSLILGLILGIFSAQILSIFTAHLFEIEMSNFTFIFSFKSLIKTIVAFGGIYVLVGIFNIVSVRKVKLINLIKADKKNQNIVIKNQFISVILFLLSLVIIGYAYYIVLKSGIAVLDQHILYSIVLGIVGTFLFFMSISGFLLTVIKNSKNVYLKNLNMFLVRQLNSKINSAFISMSFICLMLFLAICMLSAGLSLNSVMNKDIKDLTPYNMTIYNYVDSEIPELIKESGIDLSKVTDSYHFLKIYNGDLRYSDLLDEGTMKKEDSYYPIKENQNVEVLKLSDLNKELKNLGQEEIKLNKGEFAVISNFEDIQNSLKNISKENKKIKLAGKEYKAYDGEVLDLTFYNATMKCNIALIVVEDDAVDGLSAKSSYLNYNYKNLSKDEIKEIDEKLSESDYFYSVSDNDIVNTSKGTGATVSFLGIYLGIVFIIASSAVLAIQQLSNTDDNIKRYDLLRKIGIEDSDLFKAVRGEMAVYFGMPLLLAIIHSVVGLKEANAVIGIFGSGSTILKLMIIGAIFIVIIYGTYFVGTYICAKKIINKKI